MGTALPLRTFAPVFLHKLSVEFFKNLENTTLRFSKPFVCFAGENGAGKTNVLDAIYYLSAGKSYFNPQDSQNVKHEENYFTVSGEISSAETEEADEVFVGFMQGRRKTIRINKDKKPKITEHFGNYPAIIVTPYDTSLILEGSDSRRKFIDSAISLVNRPYLQHLVQYEKTLRQRNAHLKAAETVADLDQGLISIYNQKLAEHGEEIHASRKKFTIEFIPFFQQAYAAISNEKENPGLEYISNLHSGNLQELLEKSSQRDLVLHRTTKGTHRDDLEFLLDGQPAKKFASQGQQKTYLLSLKLAEFEYIREQKKVSPLLLLDDIFDRLDEQRVQSLLAYLSKLQAQQVFITDTSAERLQKNLTKISADFIVFNVHEGNITINE